MRIEPVARVVVSLFCLCASARVLAEGQKTSTNCVAEWTVTSGKAYADPFNEADVDAVVTAPDGSVQRVPAFWAGGRTWRVRYSSVQAGTHRWRIEASDRSNAELNGVAGSIEVTRYAGENPLYQHGFPRVALDRRHFEYADRTPFFWLADTWWMGLTKRLAWPEDFQRLTADRVQKGFTVVQIVAGLYPDMPAFDERGANEAGFPWAKDYSHINPEYFDAADRRIAWLCDHGIAPCIVGAWGYHLPWLGVERMKKHWRYIVARYGAYPTFWCIAGEGAMPYYLSPHKQEDVTFQKEGWTDIAAYVRSIDPHHHPVSIHPTDMSRTNVTDPDVLDFEMLQTGHSDWGSVPNTLALLKRSREAEPTMPTVDAEVCYEGILGTCHDDVVRFMTWACLLHGTAGHTYGANGIWQVNGRQVPYGASPHGGNWGNTPWDEAMALPGSGQAGIAKRLLASLDWYHFKPHPEWAMYAEELPSEKPAWGHWIWYPEGDPATDAPVAKRYFRKAFELPEESKARGVLWLTVDDRFSAYLNGKPVGSRLGWGTLQPIDVTALLRPGKNVLAVEAENLPAPVKANPAGLVCSLRVDAGQGKTMNVASDATWLASKEPAEGWNATDFDDREWKAAKDLGAFGRQPWGEIKASPSYGPFAAGIPGKVRVVYVPSPRAVRLIGMEMDGRYRLEVFDPADGSRRELGPAKVGTDGTLRVEKSGGATNDWVVIVEGAK